MAILHHPLEQAETLTMKRDLISTQQLVGVDELHLFQQAQICRAPTSHQCAGARSSKSMRGPG